MQTSRGVIRTSLNAFLLLVTALAAHAVAGGFFISTPRLSVETVMIVIGLVLCGSAELTGPKLAMLALTVQSFTHIVLGGATMSNGAMGLAHLVGGAIAYFAIDGFERFWAAFYDFVVGLVRPIAFLQIPGDRSRQVSTAPILLMNLFEFTHAFSFRGPPAGFNHA